MTLYAVVALGDLDISVHIDFSDTDVLVLALRRVPELSAERECHHDGHRS